MRLDNKQEGLRQAMSWLHTWSGLILGWVLFAVFLLGTFSYVRDEISVWMKPEIHRSQANADTPERALATLARIAPDSESWTVSLPTERNPAVEASWRNPGAPAGREGLKRATLDAATGEVLEPRATRGGDFLYRFHFEFYGMPRIWARWIVGLATMFMLVAIVTGVVVHKKIFSDFFTFRPRKGQRSWLDGHNATAVLALPFNFLITFSGLLLLMYQLMPAAIDAAYQGDSRAFFNERRMAAPAISVPAHPAQAQVPPSDALRAMWADTASLWKDSPVGQMVVTRKEGKSVSVELREVHGQSLTNRGTSRRVTYDATTGERLAITPMAEPSAATATYNVFASLHLGNFADLPVRWLLFLSGIVGSFMVASGMILWVVKRLPERKKLGKTPYGHRLVEILNASGIAGLMLAVVGYFWLNRLLPAGLGTRSDVEIQGFFLLWLATFVYAMFRSHRQAWLELLAISALAWLLLPVLNGVTGGLALPSSLMLGVWSVAGMDLCALAIGASLAFVVYKLVRHVPAGAKRPVTKAKPTASTDVATEAVRAG